MELARKIEARSEVIHAHVLENVSFRAEAAHEIDLVCVSKPKARPFVGNDLFPCWIEPLEDENSSLVKEGDRRIENQKTEGAESCNYGNYGR